MKLAIFIAYVLILVLGAAVFVLYTNANGVDERATVIDNKGRVLRNWATSIPPWAKHTQDVHDHPTPPPVDQVQPPPDPPPFW